MGKINKCFLISIFVSLFFSNFSSADELEEAWLYFLKGKYDLSESIVDTLLKNKELSPRLYYLKGLLLLKRFQFKEAGEYFDELYYYGGKWSQLSLINKADIFLLKGKFQEAGIIYSTFIKRYPRSDFIPEVLYKYGLALRKEGKWVKAKEILKMLINDYPDSLPATPARKILAENEFFFTIQIGSFLNYDNAYALNKKARSRGYNVYIRKTEYKGRLYYRVRIGKFEKRSEAEQELKKLLAQGFNGIIYP